MRERPAGTEPLRRCQADQPSRTRTRPEEQRGHATLPAVQSPRAAARRPPLHVTGEAAQAAGLGVIPGKRWQEPRSKRQGPD